MADNRTLKLRTVTRTIFTRNLNRLNEEICAENPDKELIQVSLEIVETKAKELAELDKKILDFMLDQESADLEGEIEAADEYQRRYRDIKLRGSKLLAKTPQENSILEGGDFATSSIRLDNATNGRRKFKLPKIELRKFSGNIKEWVQFWSQFQKIDDDADIAPEDKFQYLIQATNEGTRAREIIESFPPTGENYKKAIESLKTRFGREDLLVEFYIRELLKLVLQNAGRSTKGLASLCGLYDKLESQLRALETLGVTTDKCAAMLYPLVESCLPEELLRAWQRTTNLATMKEPNQRLEKMMEFLKSEVQNEERIDLAMAGFDLRAGERNPKPKTRSRENTACFDEDTPSATELLTTNSRNEDPCIFCGKQHRSVECFKAQGMDSSEKTKIAKAKGCCFACLKPGHLSKRCKAKLRCVLCGKRHVVLMCSQLQSKTLKESAKISNGKETASEECEEKSLTSLESFPGVLLQTLYVKLKSDQGECRARALIDTGSQRSYIVEQTAKKMHYQPIREETVTHSLFGGVKTHAQKHRCYKIRLQSLDGKYRCNFDALDQPVICGDVAHVGKGPWIHELEKLNISITDNLEGTGPIQLLIGADVAGKLLTGRRHILKSGLVALETLLGWTLMGKVPKQNTKDDNAAMVVTSMYIQDAAIENLWKLDIIGITDPLEQKSKNETELIIKERFQETLTRKEDGRYEVELPWREYHPQLPTNRRLAEKRLVTTTKKLDAIKMMKTYDDVLKAWLQEGIIERVPPERVGERGCYLPHRPIVKETSKTTPVRPIFDASAREKNSPSLNQCLEKGTNFLELIPSLLLKFRQRRIGVIADIEKAFLQISVQEPDRDFLRFLWWDDPEERKAVTVFRHTRVVFGVTSSPFLLGAVIDSHLQKALDDPNYDTHIIQKLKDSFYVDNVVTSVDNQDELYNFESQAKRVMLEGRFNLRGWEYSHKVIPEESDATTSVLGIQWNKEQDTLRVKLDGLKLEDKALITKRTILSVAHKIFDPIGILCPSLLIPRLLLQRTWELKLDWDTEITDDTRHDFLRWYKELIFLEEICIPRWIRVADNNERNLELHTFCDASQKAYAAAVYLRVATDEETNVYLIAAKSRVSPSKKTTIPRLELMAATIGARLGTFVKESLECSVSNTYFWTDSSTVLTWISREDPWSVFVGNRVREIRTLTKADDWKHVPTDMNPADLPSRGCTSKQLRDSRWWEGPQWLKNPINEWPHIETVVNEDDVKSEQRKTRKSVADRAFPEYQNECNTLVSTEINKQGTDEHNDNAWIYHRFSSYNSIIRLMGWVKRFIANARSPKELRIVGELSFREQDDAEKTIVRLVQEESFVNDGKLRSLKAYRDEHGIWRVKTRIIYREDSEDFCCPMILPSHHPVVKRLIMAQHKKHCHAGVQVLLGILREHYWILNGRRVIRATLAECTRCRRQDSSHADAPTAPLPEDRIKEAAVFEVTGIDLAGPLFLRNKEKAWICLFTCAVYRAVHLELVTSLSTEAFLQALRRFVSRRGRPTIIYSDNGTNFAGADNVLKCVDWKSIEHYSASNRITWRFNPPTAAWWGGWWERLVRLMKQLLRKTLGRACLTYEEMITVLCDCESVMNSRPLTYIADNDADLMPLSPSLFLKDIGNSEVPDCDEIDSRSLNKRLRYRMKLKQDLRQRFRREYLGQLVQHAESKGKKRSLSVGDIVLIESNHTKRLDWPLGRIIETIPGKEGIIRLVKLKTARGELLRPVQRIYPLEVTSPDPALDNPLAKKEIREMTSSRSELQEPQEVVTRSGRVIRKPERLNYA